MCGLKESLTRTIAEAPRKEIVGMILNHVSAFHVLVELARMQGKKQILNCALKQCRSFIDTFTKVRSSGAVLCFAVSWVEAVWQSVFWLTLTHSFTHSLAAPFCLPSLWLMDSSWFFNSPPHYDGSRSVSLFWTLVSARRRRTST